MRAVTKKLDRRRRCAWAAVYPRDVLYIRYHDAEWGVPLHNDRRIYEFFILELFQAGLSWRTVLHKRKNFRKAFAGFDYQKVSQFGRKDVVRLLKDRGIIRHRAKIEAVINNARCFMDIQKEFGSFHKYMWQWVGGKPIVHRFWTSDDYPKYIPEAVVWARDLKKRGFKFLGPTIVYAHMQAVGMVNDHAIGCFRRSHLR